MIDLVLDKFFLVKGASEGFSLLNAFDGALLAAGIGNTNLIKISSIIPPGAVKVEPFVPPPGSLVPIAYASIESQQQGEIIAAAVTAAIPEDPALPGLIMEYSHLGSKDSAIEIVSAMAEEGMKMRNCQIKEVFTTAIEQKVKQKTVAFAGVVLWK